MEGKPRQLLLRCSPPVTHMDVGNGKAMLEHRNPSMQSSETSCILDSANPWRNDSLIRDMRREFFLFYFGIINQGAAKFKFFKGRWFAARS